VPPQQQNWWVDSIFGDTPESRAEAVAKLPGDLVALLHKKSSHSDLAGIGQGYLPAELLEMVRQNLDAEKEALPMTVGEAREHRARLMEERGAFAKVAEEGWQKHQYNFCEH
jgi:hypothetical protein